MSKAVDHIAYEVVLVCATQVVVNPGKGYKDQCFFSASQIDGGNNDRRNADHKEATGLGSSDTACGKRS